MYLSILNLCQLQQLTECSAKLNAHETIVQSAILKGTMKCRGWICHSRRYFPCCIARDDTHCDVDENMWPNRQEHLPVPE